MITKELNLDLERSGIQDTVRGFYTGENGEKRIRFRLYVTDYNYSVPNDYTAALYAVKPDGTRIATQCDVYCGDVYYSPTEQTTAVEGDILCQLEIISGDGRVLYTPQFMMSVERSMQSQVISNNELSMLDQLLVDRHRHDNKAFLDGLNESSLHEHGNKEFLDGLSESSFHNHENKALLDNIGEHIEYLRETAHTHDNKGFLDGLNESSLHEHGNKEFLDGLSESSFHDHENKELLDDIGEHIDHLYKATHTHVNKADLDIITYADVVHANRQSLDKISVSEDGKLYIDGKRLENVIVWKIQKDPVIPAEADGTLLYTVYGEDGLMESDPYLVEIQGVLYRKPAPWKPGQLWVCRVGIWYLLTSESKTNFDPSEVANGGDITIGGDEGDIEDFAPAPEPEQDEMIVDGVKLLPFGKPLDLVCDKPETAHYYLADENITTNRQYLIEVLTESANRSIRIACYNGMFSVVYEKFGEQKKYYKNGSWDSAPDLSAFVIAAVKFNGIDTETVSSLDAILANDDYLKMYTSFCQAFQSCAIEDFKRYAPIDGAYEALSDTVVCDGRVYAAKLNEYTTAIQTSRDRFLGTKDSYATVYVDCDADVDVAFDADYLVGGEAPNTKAGRHKLIYNVLPDATVSLGSLDLEAVE